MLTTRTLGTQGLTVSALGLGLMGMTQAYGTPAERDERESIATIHANVRAASAVRELAARKGVTPGQIALAWLLHKGDDAVPIPGTKRRKYLEENVAAAGVRLTAGEMTALGAALAPEKIAGLRYGERQMAQVDR